MHRTKFGPDSPCYIGKIARLCWNTCAHFGASCVLEFIFTKSDISNLANSTVYALVAFGDTVRRMDKKPAPTIRDLYPDLTEAELAEAEDAHDRYLALVLRIFERLQLEAGAQSDQLTPDTGALTCEMPKSS